jgi:hypothetical protein
MANASDADRGFTDRVLRPGSAGRPGASALANRCNNAMAPTESACPMHQYGFTKSGSNRSSRAATIPN